MSLPVISVQQMREWEDATWATGQTAQAVIARVGQAVAERALKLTSTGDRILILAGKGHNGDDARAAVPLLPEREVVLIEVVDPMEALPRFPGRQAEGTFQLLIDGLFGIGINRPLSDDWQALIAAVNAAEIPVLAIDVPSGIDAESGEVHGAAIQASVTLTIGAVKRGLLAPSAIPFVGRLELAADVGLSPCPFSAELNWTTREDFKNFPPGRNPTAHKGTLGHIAIFAGSLGYHGAAVLSARGALRAQPGLVSVFTPENVYLPVASQLQAAMVHPWKAGIPLPKSCSSILMGPGFAAKDLPESFRRELVALWSDSLLPVVADASALDWLPPGGDFTDKLRVITPHPGEAARMLALSTEEVQADRVAALRQLSARHGNCHVILKGHQTLVGRSEGAIFVNSSGNSFLAQGGSGDVLAGYLSGLLAQPVLQREISRTIRYGVWQHGHAADGLAKSRPNWTVVDLLTVLGG